LNTHAFYAWPGGNLPAPPNSTTYWSFTIVISGGTMTIANSVFSGGGFGASGTALKSMIQNLMRLHANLLLGTGPDYNRMETRLGRETLFGATDSADADADANPQTAARATNLPAIAAQGVRQALVLPSGPNWPKLSSSGLSNAGLGQFGGADDGRQPYGTIDAGAPDPAASPGSGSAGFLFSGNAQDGSGNFAFSTSLSQMRAAYLGKSDPSKFDVWVQTTDGYYSLSGPDGKGGGHTALVMAGIDYVARPGLLVGMMAEGDWLGFGDGALTETANSRGWMVGPYFLAHVLPQLYVGGRAELGDSRNAIEPSGTYADVFSAGRALVSLKTIGDFMYNDFKWSPSAELSYFTETQRSFSNAFDSSGPNTGSVGRVTAGPEVSRRFVTANQTVFEPYLGVKGIWNFYATQITTSTGAIQDEPALRGLLEAGATLTLKNGVSYRASGTFDGLGSPEYKSYQANLSVNIPLP